MNKKLMSVAVAAAFAAPAAIAQTTVTIGGTINIVWDTVKASGATRNAPGANFNLLSHDRVRDGSASNIRFFVGEELGGGNQAFVQVESAVIQNSDQRVNNLGNASGFTAATGNFAPVWGNRNSAIGLRSKAAGRFLIGLWDMQYDEMHTIEAGWLTANTSSSALALWQNFGSAFTLNPAAGTRVANTIRWDSPVWSGFSMSAQYARPTDTPPTVSPVGGVGGGESVIHDKKNRAWHLALRYQTGGLQLRYGYFQDKDAVSAAGMSFAGATAAVAGTSTNKITSHRLGARYRFAMGLGIGFIWDQSKWSANYDAAMSTGIKKTSWAIPLTYDIGNHGFYATYARARDWKGTFAGFGVSDTTTAGNVNGVVNAGLPAGSVFSLANDTGAKFFSLSYNYRLSQRTNVHASYQKITNDALARYDMFTNGTGTAGANVGADPRSFAVGLRHTF